MLSVFCCVVFLCCVFVVLCFGCVVLCVVLQVRIDLILIATVCLVGFTDCVWNDRELYNPGKVVGEKSKVGSQDNKPYCVECCSNSG
jgi:hypothetical protein